MMKKYSANYSYTNHNFVIQNLTNSRKESEYLSAILIVKNLIQRGKPTILSQYLQSIYGAVHKDTEIFKSPFVLINNSNLVWNNTIKGDEENNYFPAKTFLEKRISEDLSEYEFIKQLIIPEIEINQITQRIDENFKHQCVDFFLPQANLVIEIDGQQHKEEVGRVIDSIRDNHLILSKVLTVRIDTKDLEEKNSNYFERIEEIKNQLDKYSRFLNLYKKNYNLSFAEIPKKIKKTKLLPTAIIRFQVLILELLENGILNFEDDKWIFEVKNQDVTDYENHSIEDIFEWMHHLLKLQKISFNEPQFEIRNVDEFSRENCIKIDFSLFQRWTDENTLNDDIIYVRTDYLDLFHNRNKNKLDRVNYFRLSTSKKYSYKLLFNEESDDLENLEFFLKNIFEYDKFNNGQISIIQNVLENNTTIGLLPTGGGKSLTYQLACLLQPCISFVVCPIKSLMYDQIKDLDQAYIQNIESINSDVIGPERTEILDNYSNGKYFFVFISPERFQTKDFRERLIAINSQLNFSYAVIDEVHCLSEWGHDFRTSYLNLSNTIKKYCPTINFLGLTATASVNVLKDIQLEFNTDQKNVKTLTDYTRPELEFIVINDNGKKYQEITTIVDNHNQVDNIFDLDSENPKCGLIFTPFVNGTNGCFDLSSKLTTNFNIPVKFYSGSKPKNYQNDVDFEKYKVKVQDEYKQNKFKLLTATKAFGMGINKKNISFTVHYGMPASMESLYQEAGRAGRDGKKAYAVLLTNDTDKLKIQSTLKKTMPSIEEIKSAYVALGNFFQLAIGAGFEQTFAFDIVDFCGRNKLGVLKTYHALKFLEYHEYLSLSEAFNQEAKVYIRTGKHQFENFVKKQQKFKDLLQLMLRSYGGMFDGYTKVNEKFLAQKLNIEISELQKHLKQLEMQQVLYYEARNSNPYIFFTEARMEENNLNLDAKYIQERIQTFEEKHLQMLAYSQEKKVCRSIQLLKYFGESLEFPCGICDVCLGRNIKDFELDEVEKYAFRIKKSLIKKPHSALDLMMALKENNKTKFAEILKHLIEVGFVSKNKNDLLSWRSKK